ncbi:Phosphatidylglycerophosphatase A [Phycisphaerae bacterium RAS1]|nr:Phosphatidylglycerophosphatase A [Phycisphaerae bacterium RAS1]
MSAARGDWVRTACITVLGSGFAPFASGSWGSLVAVILWVVARQALIASGAGGTVIEVATVGGVLIASALSVAWGEWAIRRFGRKDPKQFVLDEFAGQWIALLFLPLPAASASDAAASGPLAFVVAMQFVLFRAFDVIKPPPARQLERLPAGWGILLDDLFAGLYASLAGQALLRYAGVGAALGLQPATGG